ncbi:MAG: invasion activity up-regulator [Gammaproteobacteria bacterium]|nr:invasion activity up-regulator [Gammaproteobacteria bacterium]
MALADWYLPLKQTHVGLVLLSGSVFALRGVAALRGAAWPHRAALRFSTYTIDTALLTAAVLLLVILGLNPLVTPWLRAKLGLLVGYIVFGSLALRRARRVPVRWACFLAALACFLSMYVIARCRTFV